MVLTYVQILGCILALAKRTRIIRNTPCECSLGHHHLHKLLIIDLTVAVDIRLADHLVDLRVPVEGSCAEESRKIQIQFGLFLESKRPPASGKHIRKGGVLRPPPFLMGFPEAGGPFDFPNR